MTKFLIAVLVLLVAPLAAPAWGQTKLTPSEARDAAARRDPCAPIGRTEDGKLVFSMKCDRIPAPAQTQVSAPPPPAPTPAEPEIVRSGIFGMSYERR